MIEHMTDPKPLTFRGSSQDDLRAFPTIAKRETMKNEKFASIWDAIEDTPEEAENLKLRSSLMIALKARLNKTGLTQVQAAKLFGVTAPRVSDLMRGKINLFGLDSLVNMAVAAGLHVEMRVSEAA
jgi:predicted XRE-type DNA-binding protein